MILVRRPTIFDVDVLGGVAVLVFVVVSWFGVAAPVRQEYAAARECSTAIAAAEASIRRAADRGRSLEAEIRRLQAGVEDRLHRAPTPSSVPSLLTRLTALADDAGIQVLQVAPQPARKLDRYSVADIQVTARGDVMGFARLVDRLRREYPHLSVTEYAVARAKGDADARCTVAWTIRLHLLSDEFAL